MDADERRSLLLAFICVYLRLQTPRIPLALLASLAVAFWTLQSSRQGLANLDGASEST